VKVLQNPKSIGAQRAHTDCMDFEIVCPNNHDQTISFTEHEFEDTLKAGAMVFHCNTCDTNWTPTKEGLATFRKQFQH